MLLTETRLTNKNKLKITEYQTYRSDNPDGSAHGGTTILIYNYLSHHILSTNPSGNLQVTVISLSTKSRPINIAAMYCPPNKT